MLTPGVASHLWHVLRPLGVYCNDMTNEMSSKQQSARPLLAPCSSLRNKVRLYLICQFWSVKRLFRKPRPMERERTKELG
ncbi:hypothetical protein [Nitritalea halalkaliphila]|uniref:hypothetical protein n=1 Tax=Nitritalea halalkaliphila TaxID=590849 RepID=UPI0012E9A962|nr:hypothetical protein [Nitritalea halalkaliphila]